MWLIALLLLITISFALAAILGAPYLPILARNTSSVIDLAEAKSGETLIDLGSGDGRLLKQAAERGLFAIGYEINPVLYLISFINCYKYRQQIKIKLANFLVSRSKSS